MKKSSDNAEEAKLFVYLVTLAYGDKKSQTLAQVVFLRDKKGENTRSVARALIENPKNLAPKTPRFDWTTLRVEGRRCLNDQELTKLINACTKAQVGVGRVSGLELAPD